MTTAEFLLARKLGKGSGGDVTVEELTVTENGTYQEEGKAYSPVVVNVPTPENSYQLKSIANTPTDIATFNASALPMPSLTVGIEAVQSGSGDPSPTNVRPISGWTECNPSVVGKNLFAPTYFTEAGWTKTEGNEVLDVYSGNKYDFYFRHGNVRNTAEAKGIFGKLMPLGVVTISFYKMDNTNDIVYFHYVGDTSWTNASGYITTSGRKSYTSLSDKICDGIALSTTQGASATGSFGEMQIEINSEQTTYTPYQGTTTPIAFTVNGETKTIYSGYVEIVNGKVKAVATDAMVDMGDLSWSYYTQGTYPLFQVRLNGSRYGSEGTLNTMCSVYKAIANQRRSDFRSRDYNNCICLTQQSGYNEIMVQDSNYTDTTEFKTSVAGQQFVYELATPIEYDLSDVSISTQDGINNLWADSGKVISGEYMEAL